MVNTTRCGLLVSFNACSHLFGKNAKMIRPAYFDVQWAELSAKLDLLPGLELSVRRSSDLRANSWRISLAASVFSRMDRLTQSLAFFDPSADYRFGVRMQDWASVDTAELYRVFCALKYIDKKNYPKVAILMDSRWEINALSSRLQDPLLLPLVHAGTHQIVVARSRRLSVTVARIPAHANILGNEVSDFIVRSAASHPFGVRRGVSEGGRGTMRVLGFDFDTWVRALWPYVGTGRRLNGYFDHVSFKARRPWFGDLRASWYSISLVTCLKSSHICYVDHFARMRWDLDPGCGAETKTLLHLFNERPLLSEAKPGFFSFIAAWFSFFFPEQVDYSFSSLET